MPNTKSAERRVRSQARQHARNQSIQSRIKSLEKSFLALATAGKKQEASDALRVVVAAFDKAAKSGVLHRNNASRKKSRLATRLSKLP